MKQLTKRNIGTSLSLKNKMLHWNLLYDLLIREFVEILYLPSIKLKSNQHTRFIEKVILVYLKNKE